MFGSPIRALDNEEYIFAHHRIYRAVSGTRGGLDKYLRNDWINQQSRQAEQKEKTFTKTQVVPA